MIKVFKFELKNILRSRWIFGYFIFSMALVSGLSYLSSDQNRVMVSLALILPVLVPLVTLSFSTLHWYYNERFTILLLTQPISRTTVLLSRYFALSFSLLLAVMLGVVSPFIFRLTWPEGLNLILTHVLILTFISVGIALYISALIEDRLKGIGCVLACWMYMSLLHDGLLLILLILFRDSPMDFIAGSFSALNPMSLSRVAQLLFFDQPLLLGHTGALTKQLLTSWKGYTYGILIVILWLFIPLKASLHAFKKKDL